MRRATITSTDSGVKGPWRPTPASPMANEAPAQYPLGDASGLTPSDSGLYRWGHDPWLHQERERDTLQARRNTMR